MCHGLTHGCRNSCWRDQRKDGGHWPCSDQCGFNQGREKRDFYACVLVFSLESDDRSFQGGKINEKIMGLHIPRGNSLHHVTDIKKWEEDRNPSFPCFHSFSDFSAESLRGRQKGISPLILLLFIPRQIKEEEEKRKRVAKFHPP